MTMLWCPGAELIYGGQPGGSMTGGPPRVIWHRTVGGTYESNKQYLIAERFEPHLLWDPYTGQIGQYLPATRSGYAVRHTGNVETNRMGEVCIQVEVVDRGQTWDITDTPMLALPNILAFLRANAIPDQLPAGPMAPLGSDGNRNPNTWATAAGHYGHCHVPGNTHTDPGPMDFTRIFRQPAPSPAPQPSEEDEMKPLLTRDSAGRIWLVSVQALHRIWVGTPDDVRMYTGQGAVPVQLSDASLARIPIAA